MFLTESENMWKCVLPVEVGKKEREGVPSYTSGQAHGEEIFLCSGAVLSIFLPLTIYEWDIFGQLNF